MYDLAIEQILFMDIETVPLYKGLEEIPTLLREYWESRYEKKRPESLSSEEYFVEKAGIHALYSRVACISLGYFSTRNDKTEWRQYTFADLDEARLLQSFADRWNSFKSYAADLRRFLPETRADYGVCGHNIASFDLPFLGRRFLCTGVSLPDFWRLSQWQQPWSLKSPTVIDTMNLWSFTSREQTYIPLEILAHALGINFRKTLSHLDIRNAFYEWERTNDESFFEPVKEYCAKDVRTVAEIYIHMQVPAEKKEPYLRALQGYESK
ncbi:MAG: ribonuclease H-like domain-containing protein [Bacteroidia bacterium]|nr:ribonuclease H-like domain-containing protein [Bacteroidia bacterium]